MGMYKKWRWYDLTSILLFLALLTFVAWMAWIIFSGTAAHGKDLKAVTAQYDDGTQETIPANDLLTTALKSYFQGLQPPPTTPPPAPPPPQAKATTGTTQWQMNVNGEGWVLPPISPSSRTLYISPAGQDSNPGTQSAPLKTLAAAIALANRTFLPQNGQWILNLSGQSHTGRLDNLPSGTPQYPTIVQTVPGQQQQRALISAPPGQSPCILQGKHDLLIYNVGFVAPDRLQKSSRTDVDGVYAYNCSRIWVEGCSFSYFTNNLVTQASDNTRSTDIVVRRNVNVWNFAAPKNPVKHSEGYYVHRVDRLLHEENYYIHNGYNLTVNAPATPFNQAVYQTGENTQVINRGNVVLGAAACAIQARSGGDFTDNVAIDCPIGFSWGLVNGGGPQYPGGVSGSYLRNVVVGGGLIGKEPRSIGFQFGNIHSATIADNLCTQLRQQNPYKLGYAFSFEHGEGVFQAKQIGIHNVTFQNNVADGWTPGFYVEPKFLPVAKGEWSFGPFQIIDCDLPAAQPIPSVVIPTNRKPQTATKQAPMMTAEGMQAKLLMQQPYKWDPNLTGKAISESLRP